MILDELARSGHVRVSAIAHALAASEITIRRDLTDLEAERRLVRVHGGAVLPEDSEEARANRNVIGVILPSTDYYFGDVIRGIMQVCGSRNVRPVLGVSDGQPSTERQQVERLRDLGVGGLIIATAAPDNDPAEARRTLAAVGLPTVLVERSFGSPALEHEYSHVRTDHAHGARLALRHLRRLGHERVGLIGIATSTLDWLQRGLESGQREFGSDTPIPTFALPVSTVSARSAKPMMSEILPELRRERVTALLIHSDREAVAFIEVARTNGLRIPQDLAIVAYDDVYGALQEVGLTAIDAPKFQVGAEAARVLFRDLAASKDETPLVHHLSLLPRLVVRSSCGAPASSHARSADD